MSLEPRIRAVFTEVLDLDSDTDFASLKYNVHPTWNSLAHLALISGLENEFDIAFEMDEILGMSDFAKAVDYVGRHCTAT